jgi:hypothetical protein
VADLAAAFAEIRTSLTEQLLAVDADAWATPIPTRPDWTVKDTVAMMTGFAQALINGRWTDDYSDSWTDAGLLEKLHLEFEAMIAERRDKTGPEILEEWSAHAPRLERMMRSEEPFPKGTQAFAPWGYLWAVVQNGHNIWSALGVAAKERDATATRLCVESAVFWLDMRLQAVGGPALRLRTGEREWVVGDGVPAATVTAPSFELFRALSGRRSLDQIREFSWEGDPQPFLAVFSPFRPPREAIVE